MVDSVQNNGTNNTALYTALGAGVGAVGGAAYGKYLTKPYLKDNAPSDQFIRTAHDTLNDSNAAKAGEKAKETAKTALKDKEIDALKGELKANAATYGLAEVKDSEGKVTKDLDKVIEEYVGSESDKAKLAEKMANSADEAAKKAVQDSHVSGQKLGDAIDEIAKLTDEAKAEDIKAAVKKHAEAFGIKAEDADVDGLVGSKKASELKTILEDKLKSTKETVESFFSEGKLKAEADIAEDSKPAFKAVKDAIGKLTNKAALKWGGIAAAVLGVIGLGAGLATKKAPEKAPEEEQHISAQA